MKLINSKNSSLVEKLGITNFDDFNDREYVSPCWEVSIDRKRGDMVFLIDCKEFLSCPIKQLDESFFTMDKISILLKYLRNNDMKELRKILGIKKGK